jgi:hypothetical protein
MKHVIAALAALLVATSAYATDLPKKKKAPLPPVQQFVQKQVPTTTVTAEVSSEGDLKAINDGTFAYTLGVEHKVGYGFFVAAQAQHKEGDTDNSIEGSVGYTLPLTSSVSVKASVGTGKHFVTGDNYAYYVARLGTDVKLSDHLTWNALQYRYRNSYDTAYDYESHQIGTGLTYHFNQQHAVFAKVFRNYDHNFNNHVDDTVLVGYSFSF